MSEPRRIVLDLHIDMVVDPIEGAVRAGDGELVDFSGWLGLAAALERVALAATREAAVRAPSP